MRPLEGVNKDEDYLGLRCHPYGGGEDPYTADAYGMAGGIGGGEGSALILMKSSSEQVTTAWKIIEGIKGEEGISAHPSNCVRCVERSTLKLPSTQKCARFTCPWSGSSPEDLPIYARTQQMGSCP